MAVVADLKPEGEKKNTSQLHIYIYINIFFFPQKKIL